MSASSIPFPLDSTHSSSDCVDSTTSLSSSSDSHDSDDLQQRNLESSPTIERLQRLDDGGGGSDVRSSDDSSLAGAVVGFDDTDKTEQKEKGGNDKGEDASSSSVENEKGNKNDDDGDNLPLPIPLLIWRVVAIMFTSAAYSIPWSLQIGYSSPYLESLSLPERFISLTWLAAPVSGIFLGLSISAISDAVFIPFLGRRRPLLLIGSFFIGLALTVFPNSHVVGDGWNHIRSQVTGAMSFVVLDFSVTFVTIALNTLLIDVIPARQQVIATALSTLGGGLGNFLGFGLGVIPWIRVVPYASVNFQPLCTVSLAIYLLFVSLTCLMLREEKEIPKEEEEEGEEEPAEAELTDEIGKDGGEVMVEIPLERHHSSSDDENVVVPVPILDDGCDTVVAPSSSVEGRRDSVGDEDESEQDEEDEEKKRPKKCCCACLLVFRHLNWSYWGAYITLFLTLFVSFLFLVMSTDNTPNSTAKYFAYIFLAQFIGSEVYHGSAKAPPGTELRERYEEGVRWGNFCLVALSVVCMVYAPIIAALARCVPVKLLWAIGQFLLGVSFTLPVILPTKWIVMLICATFGVVQATMSTVPWSIMNVVCRENRNLHPHKAFVLGIFNTATCMPEILVASFGGYLSEILTNTFHLPFRFIFAFAAGSGWLSLLACLLVPIPKSLQLKKKNRCCGLCRPKEPSADVEVVRELDDLEDGVDENPDG